jgi:hypothetical protein
MKGKWKQWVSGGYIYESGASYMYLLQWVTRIEKHTGSLTRRELWRY